MSSYMTCRIPFPSGQWRRPTNPPIAHICRWRNLAVLFISDICRQSQPIREWPERTFTWREKSLETTTTYSDSSTSRCEIKKSVCESRSLYENGTQPRERQCCLEWQETSRLWADCTIMRLSVSSVERSPQSRMWRNIVNPCITGLDICVTNATMPQVLSKHWKFTWRERCHLYQSEERKMSQLVLSVEKIQTWSSP